QTSQLYPSGTCVPGNGEVCSSRDNVSSPCGGVQLPRALVWSDSGSESAIIAIIPNQWVHTSPASMRGSMIAFTCSHCGRTGESHEGRCVHCGQPAPGLSLQPSLPTAPQECRPGWPPRTLVLGAGFAAMLVLLLGTIVALLFASQAWHSAQQAQETAVQA